MLFKNSLKMFALVVVGLGFQQLTSMGKRSVEEIYGARPDKMYTDAPARQKMRPQNRTTNFSLEITEEAAGRISPELQQLLSQGINELSISLVEDENGLRLVCTPKNS